MAFLIFVVIWVVVMSGGPVNVIAAFFKHLLALLDKVTFNEED